jgi:uncharacterized protein
MATNPSSEDPIRAARTLCPAGFVYQRRLTDPDGNILEFGYMDPVAAEQGPEAFANQQD